jgi:hypothetical protein
LSLLQHETETEYTTADRTQSFFLNNVGIIPHPRSYFNIKCKTEIFYNEVPPNISKEYWQLQHTCTTISVFFPYNLHFLTFESGTLKSI